MEATRKYKIIYARVEVLDGSFTNLVLGEVEFEMEGPKRHLYLLEIDGMPEFWLTEEEIWERFESEDDSTGLADTFIRSFDGIELPCDYDELVSNLKQGQPADGLLMFLIALVRCPNEEVEQVMRLGIGRYSDEIEVPSKYLCEEEER